MTHAYRDLRRLQQETTYGVAGEPGPDGLVRSRLLVERPNRILLDIIQQSAGSPKPQLTRIQCDGKQLYSYRERNGWFAKQKAPKTLADLNDLAFSLEVAAITGGDPVSNLMRQARSVTVEAAVAIDGCQADVIAMDTTSATATGTIRLTIGQHDHLLRRFDMETGPPDPKTAPARPEERLGPLAGLAPEEPAPAAPAHFVYENHIVSTSRLPQDAFAWVAPAGSYEYQPFPSLLGPVAGGSQAGQAAAAMPPGITPRKVISIQDLMKNARKPGQKK